MPDVADAPADGALVKRTPGSTTKRGGRARHFVRTRWSEHPSLYMPFARRKYPGTNPDVVGPHTQVVIDGYTRSATTFAVYAFQLAQSEPVRLAHHLHAPAQLVVAAKMGIPVIALIRRPEDAILSQVIREPGVSIRGALAAYARFYRRLMPYRVGMIAGEFDEITNDLGAITRRVNERFGTSFEEFRTSETNVQEVLDLAAERPTAIPEWSTLLGRFESGLASRDEVRAGVAAFAQRESSEWTNAWVPSTARTERKQQLRDRWSDPSLATLRDRANAAYDAFINER
jgi:hypothetical protein